MASMDAICFSEDIDFACHIVATHPPPTFPPCRSASGIGYTIIILSKMVDNSAIYSLNSC